MTQIAKLLVSAIRLRPTSASVEGARRGPTLAQWLVTGGLVVSLSLALAVAPRPAASVLHAVFFVVFGLGIWWRLLAIGLSHGRGGPAPHPLPDDALPAYTIIAPLYREAAIAAQLIRNLERIDYPRSRLQILLALEADDHATRTAVLAAAPPPHVELVIAPPGEPRTKPRACNVALERARGELVVVYDAEDEPDPGQLREAAARFAAAVAENGAPLGCLQAPLRMRPRASFLTRQFALEYAALFEVTLPALARLGLPFPLGGTSNHFQRTALVSAGGWDAYNVTEDADMGFRLARAGWRLGVIRRPTWEEPPRDLDIWTPQRTRWIKGYMQTWGVHMRTPFRRLRDLAALQLTVGYAIVSAVLHGPLMLLLGASLLLSVSALPGRCHWPDIALCDLALLGGGWGAATLVMARGARRAALAMTLADALSAPAYWPLQSIAAAFAAQQLVARPFHWDKTEHLPAPAPASEVAAAIAA